MNFAYPYRCALLSRDGDSVHRQGARSPILSKECLDQIKNWEAKFFQLIQDICLIFLKADSRSSWSNKSQQIILFKILIFIS